MKVMQSFDGLDLVLLLTLFAVLAGIAMVLDLRSRRDREETELWRGDQK